MPSTPASRLRAVALVAVVTTILAGCAHRTDRPVATSSQLGLRPSAPLSMTPTATTTAPATTSPTAPPTLTYSIHQSETSPATSVAVRPATSAAADAQIASETAYLGSGGVSIEAVNLHSGVSFAYGASGGMRTGSIAKLYILETLLLQHQNAGTSMSATQKQLATAMIEHSDNDAANDLWNVVGRAPALTRVAETLGVEHTVPGPGIFWGYTQTCASDYVALLRNLVAPSALNAASRAYVLGLMSNIESDQRWGVSAAADPRTTVWLKNGWLGTTLDRGRWLVNSVGVVTVHGQTVLLAVLTQHGRDFESGIDLVQSLAKIAAGVVAAS